MKGRAELSKALAPIEQVTQAEALLAQAVQGLSRAKTLVEVLNAGDLARVVRECLELRKRGSGAHASAWETVVLADARAGQYTRKLPQGKRGPKGAKEAISPIGGENFANKTEAIAQLGLTSQDVSRFERLAEIPDKELRARIEAGKQDILAGKRPRPVTAVTSATGHDGDCFSTPAKYVEPARELMGGIELDPASNESAQRVVRAKRYYTIERDGLAKPWRARSIWLNPPYSRGEMDKWVAQLLEAKAANGFEHLTMLTNTDNSTGWWRTLAESCAAFCAVAERIPFELDGKPVRGNEHPQTIFYFGPKLPGFARLYAPHGPIFTCYRKRGDPRPDLPQKKRRK